MQKTLPRCGRDSIVVTIPHNDILGTTRRRGPSGRRDQRQPSRVGSIMDLLPYLGQREEHKPSTFDYVTRLLIPLSALLVAILGLVRKPSPVLWFVLAFALLILVIGIFPVLSARIRKWTDRAKDRRAARKAFPEFRKFVRRFGEFVNTSSNNTLHSIIEHEASKAPGQTVATPEIPNIGLWNAFWYHLAQRVQRQRTSISEFHFALSEFYSLVGLYDTGCVVRIFNDSRPEFRDWLASGTAKGSLNEFQQRFLNFLLDYEKFVTELAESRRVFKDLPRNFPHPNPL